MKAAIWGVAPSGDFVFRGGGGQELDITCVDYEPLIDSISEQFGGTWVTPAQIAKFVGSDKTVYHSSQFKKNALKPLEQRGKLVIHDDDLARRSRRFTYRDDIRLMILP